MSISKLTSKVIGPKRRWRKYKARIRRLPTNYRTAAEGLERYLMLFGPTDADGFASMFEDLADLFERAAADGTPIREIVGEDPVEFSEVFLQAYSEGGWVTRERKRLITAIEQAEHAEGGADQ